MNNEKKITNSERFLNFINRITTTQICTYILIVFVVGIGFFSIYGYPYFIFHQLNLIVITIITIVALKEMFKFLPEIDSKLDRNLAHSELLLKINKYRKSEWCIAIPILLGIFYFYNIYLLGYYKLNILGVYIIALGFSTLFLALFCYVQFVIIVIYIYNLLKIKSQRYNRYDPSNTDWLIYISKSTNKIKLVFFIAGLLFTIQYAVLSPANAITFSGRQIIFNVQNTYSYILTWGGILIFIIIGFPFSSYISNLLIKLIVKKYKNFTISNLENILNQYLASNRIANDKEIETIKIYSTLIKDVKNSSDLPIEKPNNKLSIFLTIATISVHLSNIIINITKFKL